jgi:hypothetical protein
MTERTDKKYEDWNKRDMIRYYRKTLKSGKQLSGSGWQKLTPDDIDYMKKQIEKFKSELLDDPDMFLSDEEIQKELKNLKEEDIGEFELCDAQCCSVCGNYSHDDLDSIACGILPNGDEVFECPFCGSWNRSE